jgi:type IV pilus assembly protein PilB
VKTTTPIPAKRPPLGEILVGEGRITPAELEAALAYKEERGIKLGQALIALHLVSQSDLARALRAQGKFYCLELTPEIVDLSVAQSLGEQLSRGLQAVAVNCIGGIVTVAMEDPSETYNIDAISIHLCAPVLAVHADPQCIERCLEAVFVRDELRSPSGESAAFQAPEVCPSTFDLSMTRELELEGGARPEHVVCAVLEEALLSGATDVHFEPQESALAVRFRLDGRLVERTALASTMIEPILAELQSLAGLPESGETGPQVAHARIEIGSRPALLRLAIGESLFGRTAVVRLTEAGRTAVDVADLGLSPYQRAEVKRLLGRVYGLTLVAGPPRSGRTTTLYALARRLATDGRKVVIVDRAPVYTVPGAVQMLIGRSGEQALRAALAHEPDVLVVGELDDVATARLALGAAQEGRCVLTTVSAIDSAEAIVRMVSIGVDPVVLAATLQYVVAHCQVRRICPRCRREAPPTHELRDAFARRANDGPFFEGAGCEHCRGSGYRGSLALFEVLRMDAELARLVRTGAAPDELRTAAVARGMTRLVGDAMHKALAGETTLSELRGRAAL